MSDAGFRRFRWRAFVAFGMLFSFLATSVAGVILYLRPEGSLASWTGWNILGIDKKGWEGIHTLLVIPFLIFAVGHIVLNARSILHYIRTTAFRGWRAKIEFGAALGLLALVFAAAAGRWQPLWKVIDFRSAIKDGRYSVATAPPVVNAEELTLSELEKLAGLPEGQALSRLGAAGMTGLHGGVTLDEIAAAHGMSPEKLYEIIIAPESQGPAAGKPRRDRSRGALDRGARVTSSDQVTEAGRLDSKRRNP